MFTAFAFPMGFFYALCGYNMEEKMKTKLIAIAEKLGVSIYETELGTPYQLNFKPIRHQKL